MEQKKVGLTKEEAHRFVLKLLKVLSKFSKKGKHEQ